MRIMLDQYLCSSKTKILWMNAIS